MEQELFSVAQKSVKWLVKCAQQSWKFLCYLLHLQKVWKRDPQCPISNSRSVITVLKIDLNVGI
jgi:hypothetical protein